MPSSGPWTGASAEQVDTGSRPGTSGCRLAFYSHLGWLAQNPPVLLPFCGASGKIAGAWLTAVAGGWAAWAACAGDRSAAANAGGKETRDESPQTSPAGRFSPRPL